MPVFPPSLPSKQAYVLVSCLEHASGSYEIFYILKRELLQYYINSGVRRTGNWAKCLWWLLQISQSRVFRRLVAKPNPIRYLIEQSRPWCNPTQTTDYFRHTVIWQEIISQKISGDTQIISPNICLDATVTEDWIAMKQFVWMTAK